MGLNVKAHGDRVEIEDLRSQDGKRHPGYSQVIFGRSVKRKDGVLSQLSAYRRLR
jgi:hypothetical protein